LRPGAQLTGFPRPVQHREQSRAPLAANALAGALGASRYPIVAFLGYDLVGRLLWTVGYFGLGYAFGGSVETVVDFLAGVSGLLLAVAVAAAAGYGLCRNGCRR
jgi:membrane protein DedA with SNARE-associated domain